MLHILDYRIFQLKDFPLMLMQVLIQGNLEHLDLKMTSYNIDKNKRNGEENESIFDKLLYKQRLVIERTNAWLDILVRFETNKIH